MEVNRIIPSREIYPKIEKSADRKGKKEEQDQKKKKKKKEERGLDALFENLAENLNKESGKEEIY